MALNNAKGSKRQRQIDWSALLPLAGGTLFLLLGIFCGWQSWLVADEGHAIDRVHQAQDAAVRAIADEISQQRAKVLRVLDSVDPATIMTDPAQSAAALRQKLPEASKLELYSGDLNEVLHANYREFGYAKAAQLMAAQTAEGTPLVQSVSYGNGDRRLSLVISLGLPQQTAAWAWVELPFAPLKKRFEAISPAGGRLELRQGDDMGSIQLLSHGSS